MNRAELRQLAEDRVLDAGALLAAQRWSAAYYLAGYSVECGLKACITAYVENNAHVIFERRDFSAKCWTHNIEDLLTLADPTNARKQDALNDPILGQNWAVVKDWAETARYEQKTEAQATDLYNAITDKVHGVLLWIRARW